MNFDKERWRSEAITDKNPNIVEYYKKQSEEKERTILTMSKNLKKFAIVEKKLNVKDKVFQAERSEYIEQLLYLN